MKESVTLKNGGYKLLLNWLNDVCCVFLISHRLSWLKLCTWFIIIYLNWSWEIWFESINNEGSLIGLLLSGKFCPHWKYVHCFIGYHELMYRNVSIEKFSVLLISSLSSVNLPTLLSLQQLTRKCTLFFYLTSLSWSFT